MWAGLPRRKCDDCGKSYKPSRPLQDGQRGFCCDNCRKSYHKHGGAYRKLRGLVRQMAQKEFDAQRELIAQEIAAMRSVVEGISKAEAERQTASEVRARVIAAKVLGPQTK